MSDDTIATIVEKITVRYPKQVKLPSGHTSNVFFDCIQLSPGDLARLAAQATGHLDHDSFDIAVGLAFTGVFFGAAVAGGRLVGALDQAGVYHGPAIKGKRVVLVDDVVVSGRGLKAAAQKLSALGASVVGHACIIDRSDGSFTSDKAPLWSAAQVPL